MKNSAAKTESRRSSAEIRREPAAQKSAPDRPAAAPITKADLFSLGLSGKPNSQEKRAALAKSLDLPTDLPASALLSALNILFARDEFLSRAGSLGL